MASRHDQCIPSHRARFLDTPILTVPVDYESKAVLKYSTNYPVMKIRSISYPSVIQGHSTELVNVSSNLLNGLKIKENGLDYLVGNLALSEGRNPHKAINSNSDETDYKVLLKAGLLLASNVSNKPMVLTTGFPYATYNINKKTVKNTLASLDSILHDSSTYGGPYHQEVPVQLSHVEVLPELIGGIIAARHDEEARSGSFFMVSLGYGTIEIGLSTDDGIVHKTEATAPGLRYAVDWARKDLMQNYYVGLRSEHQFDMAFQNGVITVNRKRIDLGDIRKRSLAKYYNEVISPLMRNTWDDEDFNRANTIVLVGGGALYPDLVHSFKEEFIGLADIEIPENPELMASKGYCIRSCQLVKSLQASGENGQIAVGIDIGNAQSSVSIYEPA